MSALDQALLNFVTAGLGALVAGYFGVWFGVAKLKRERAFDRRLEWYQKTIEVAHELANKTEVALHVGSQGNAEYAAKLFEQVAPIAMRFNELSSDAYLFATPQAFRALKDIHRRLNRLSPGLSGPVATRESGTAAAKETIAILRSTGFILGADVREQLGLEKLDPKAGSDAPTVPPAA